MDGDVPLADLQKMARLVEMGHSEPVCGINPPRKTRVTEAESEKTDRSPSNPPPCGEPTEPDGAKKGN